ncbi:MAG: hypothetical protein U0232_24530 [Thermomicrobiales bacterium]
MRSIGTGCWLPERWGCWNCYQRALPHEVVYLRYDTCGAVAAAIRDMVIRGTGDRRGGGYVAALAALGGRRPTRRGCAELMMGGGAARVAPDGGESRLGGGPGAGGGGESGALTRRGVIRAAVLAEAHAIRDGNARMMRQMSEHALALFPDSAGHPPLQHRGAGDGRIWHGAGGDPRCARARARLQALVEETRPRLQGARLTAWELRELGIPHTVIVDGASGHFMRTQGVDLCVVGCDRVAANGDTANKIGTYNLALVAQCTRCPVLRHRPDEHDRSAHSRRRRYLIEERVADEVRTSAASSLDPDGVTVANPAFDGDPRALHQHAIVNAAGIAYPPYEESLARLVAQARRYRECNDSL